MVKKMIVLLSTAVVLSACREETPILAATQGTEVKTTAEIQLTDISEHWAKDSINKAVEKQYVDGYEDQTFRPEQNVSRAEFIKMTATAMKLSITGENAGASWYQPYVAAATEKGILRTTDFPIEEINEPITRLEMAKISLRSTDEKLQNKAVQIDNLSVMYNATKSGLVQGLTGGELAPDHTTTRAQSVTIIERILTDNAGGKLEVDKYAISQAELELKNTNIFSVIPEIFGGKQFEGGPIKKWDVTNLTIEAPDGKFKGSLDQLIAIDMEDPNDPNRALLGNIDELKWLIYGSEVTPYVKDYPKSYIIFHKSHVDYNKDPNSYAEGVDLFLSIYGFEHPDRAAFERGVLNKVTSVYRDQLGDVPALIIPKSGYLIDGSVSISLYAPAYPPQSDHAKVILSVAVPK
jgi:hypothetical protein